MLGKRIRKFIGSHPAVLRSCKTDDVQKTVETKKKKEVRVGCDWFWVRAPHTALDPPGPLHCIWPKTKLIAEDGDVRDSSGWVHCRAAGLTLGVIFVCVNVGKCAALIARSVWGSWQRHHRDLPQTLHLLRAAVCFLFSLCVWRNALVFASLAFRIKTTPGCDYFTKQIRYFCPYYVIDYFWDKQQQSSRTVAAIAIASCYPELSVIHCLIHSHNLHTFTRIYYASWQDMSTSM